MKKFFIEFIQEKLYSHKKLKIRVFDANKNQAKRPLNLKEIFK